MSINVAVPSRQLRRIAKSPAVPSPSCVTDAGVRRVSSRSRLDDMCDQVGWRCRRPTRREEFARCARRSSSQ